MHRIETLRRGDRPHRDALARLAFGAPAPLPDDRPAPLEDQSVGAYVGDRLVANVTVLADAQWFGGQAVASAGVTSVAVAPDQRGKNLARGVVSEALLRAHARGDAIAALYPTTATLYRSLGFELAGWYRCTDAPVDSLTGLRPPDDVVVEPSDHRAVEAAYDATAAHHDGWLQRSTLMRAIQRFDHEHLAAPTAVWRAHRDGVTVGALAYSEVNQGHLRPFDIVASQLFATDTGALRALVALVAAHGTMGDNLRTVLPAELLALAVPQGQLLVTARQFPWMLRILDAPRAVAQRGYAPQLDLEVHLAIAGDDIVVGNNGHFVLQVRDGEGTLEPGGSGEVAIDIRALAAAYSGFGAEDPRLRLAFAGRSPTLVDFF
jgi:predicted acetyltransferase